eukprot:scaffold97708_cov33-Prasinocladus_malaysianus.AAC.1
MDICFCLEDGKGFIRRQQAHCFVSRHRHTTWLPSDTVDPGPVLVWAALDALVAVDRWLSAMLTGAAGASVPTVEAALPCILAADSTCADINQIKQITIALMSRQNFIQKIKNYY